MATNKQFQQYLWLVDTIYSSGSISLSGIARKWEQSSFYMDSYTPFDRRTFFRHRDNIEELFGISIKCDRHTQRYSIENISDLRGDDIRNWVLNTFSLGCIANMSANLKERVIFEDIPSGMRLLSTIARSMQDGKLLEVTYQRFGAQPHTFKLAPYCLKANQRRWYLVGKPNDHPEEKAPRVYGLDRIIGMRVLDERFRMPKRFHADVFFRDYYGIDRRESPCFIAISTDHQTADYLRSLPLHTSQQEESGEGDNVIFRYFVAPTIDFVQQLRQQGPMLEVLSPDWLRDQFREEARTLLGMYGG